MPHKYTVCVNVHLFAFKGPTRGDLELLIDVAVK